MATYTWIGGTGTWNTSNTAVWSPAGVPTAADNVIFNSATTYTVTMTGALACLDFTVSAGTVTFATGTTPTLAVSGSMSLVSGTVWSSTGTTTFNATSSKTIASGNTAINGNVTFNGVGGSWQLQDNLTLVAARTCTLTNGTINLNNFSLTTGLFSSTGSGVRSIAFGTGNITCNSTAGGTIWTTATATNLTISGTPNVNIDNSGAVATTIASGATTETTVFSFNIISGSYILTSPNFFRSLNFSTAFSGTWTPAAQSLTCFGDMTLSSAMSFGGGAGGVTFSATSGIQTITSNGLSWATPITQSNSNATLRLADALTQTTYQYLHNSGTLDLNGKTLTPGTNYATGAGTKNITFNAGTLLCAAATTSAFNNAAPTGFSTTAGTGVGKISMTAATAKTFVGGGSTYNCTLSNDGAGALTISGSNTFTSIANGVQPAAFTFTSSTTQTITNWLINGAPANLVTIISSTAGTAATISKASGTVSCNYVSLKDSTATGGATFFAGTGSTNVSGNTGWSFTAAPLTYYWIGGAGNWSSTAKWSLNSGGTIATAVPTSTDNVVFDANSGLVGLIATVDTAQTCATLTLTPGATVGFSTIAITASLTVSGLFSMSGTAGNQRFLICGTTYGLATDFSVGSASGLSDLDCRDLRVIGTAAPLSGTRIGDLRGVTGVTFNAAKQVYWVTAAGGNWSGNNWSNTAGGAASTIYFPLAQDTATFVNTGLNTGATVTWDVAIPYAGSIDMSARSNGMTLSFTTSRTAYGNWTNGSGTTVSNTGGLNFSGRNTQTVTSAGKAMATGGGFIIDTYGGTVQLADPLNIGANALIVTNGTFDTNGQNVTALSLSSNNANVRAINLGASTLTLSGSSPIQMTSATNLTFNAGTSTIDISYTGSFTFSGGSLTFNNVTCTSTVASSQNSIGGANTFANLTLTNSLTGLMQFTFSANQTITGTLTCAGSLVTRRNFLRSDTVGTQRTLTCGAISADDCDFRDIAIAGAAAPYNAGSLRVGDCGNNSGITFPAGVPKYWNLAGTQNWSATGWATSSGGTPAANNFPLAQDTATFNAASGAIGTITINAPWNIGTVDMTGRVVTTFPMTLTTSTNAPTVYGSWLFDTGVTSSSTTGAITFGGRGTQTITSRGITFGCPVTVDSSTGTVQLADALTLGATRTLTLTTGTFDAVTYPVSVGLASFAAGTLKMGSNTWTLSGTGSVWSFTGGTLYKGTANIVLSDTSTTARTFTGGAQSYNKLTIGGATGISTLNITGINQFTEIASTKTVAHTIALSTTTQTVGAWTVTGTVGNVVTVTGTATLTIAGARVSGVDYLAMGTTAISTTSPGEFYAGANSTGTGTGVILTAAPAAVTRWWRGGNGTWDATTTTNWSSSVGDVRPASVPTSADNVVFDSVSNATAYLVTCTATQLRCASLTIAGPATGNLTFAGTAPLAIHGNVILPATGMTRTYTGAITLTGSATGKTFTTNGVSLASAMTVNGVGCGWALGFALTSTSTFTVTNGSFDTANFALSCTTLSSSNSNTRSITFGTSTMTISGFSLSATNLTFSAGSSTINSGAGTGTIDFGGLSFGTFNFTSNATSITINGANTFTNLSMFGRTSAGVGGIIFSADQTITGTLTIPAGTDATMRNFLQSNTLGTTRTLTCGAISAQDADFRDIAIAGAAAPYNASSLRIGDCKGNSGITFPAGVPKYWNLIAGGNWGGAIAWATTSGGTPAINNFPLAQDTAWFEAAGLNNGVTVTINASYNIGTINMAARTVSGPPRQIVLGSGVTAPTIYGDWINGSGCSFTGTGAITFAGRGSQTITSAGASAFTQPFTINTPGGSVTLADAFSSSNSTTSALLLTTGTFNANGQNVTLSGAASSVSSSNSNTRTIAVGSGIWTLSGTAPWTATTSTNLTVTGTGTIKLTSASAKTFAGGGLAYTNITLDQGGAGQLNISDNNTFGNITNTYGATGAATINFAATTTTLSQFTAAGTAGNLLTIQGTSAASPATLILTSGTVNSNYLAVSNIKAYATTSTWYAGTNSTNGGTLGWIFSSLSVTANGNFFSFF